MSLPAKTSAVRPGARLKHPTGWFAAGGEVSRALQLLSDGAFKLYMHLCLKADRSTGQYKGDSVDLVKALGKSRRSVVVYLEESLQNTVRQESARTGSDRDLRRLLALRKATRSGEAAKPGGLHYIHPPSAGGPGVREGLVQSGGREIGGR